MSILLVILVTGLSIGVGLVVSAMRSPASFTVANASQTASIVIPSDPATSLRIVADFALRTGYGIVRVDEAALALCLEESPSLTTWGFFLPIEIHAVDAGSEIRVGIKSKFVQVGPIVTAHLNRFVGALTAAAAVRSPA